MIFYRAGLALLGLALVLAFGPHLAVAGSAREPLTPEWIERVAAKEEARRLDPHAAGTSNVRAPNPAGPDAPAKRFTQQVRTSKAEMLRRYEESRVSADRYIAELGPRNQAAIQLLRRQLAAERALIESYPDGDFTVELEGIETGSHSISYTVHAYLVDGVTKADPISFVFYNVGSSWDVNYDMQNWTTPLWNGQLVCGADLWVYTWDAQHGGTDGWSKQIHHLQYDAGVCGTARYHVRLFDRGYNDNHGQYGRWTISEPHHDRAGDHCVDDWESSQELLRQSFLDGNGNKHLFVGSMYQYSFSNGDWYGCDGAKVYADGWGWYVELLY